MTSRQPAAAPARAALPSVLTLVKTSGASALVLLANEFRNTEQIAANKDQRF